MFARFMALFGSRVTTTSGPGERHVEREVAFALAGVLVLYVLARLAFGPVPQPASYHLLADERILAGAVPHAGDVLTNLAILAAGLLAIALHPRMSLSPGERPVALMLIAGTFLTAAGSAYYHWAPSNATLVWDRLPMMLTIPPALVLVLADRLDPRFARAAFLPFVVFATASVVWWATSGTIGREDVLLYLMVRILMPLTVLVLVVFKPSRYTASGWLIAAIVCEGMAFFFERFDYQTYAATGGIASGHNLKHVTVGVALACFFAWLRFRRPRAAAA